jgi:hypothetical protein
MSMLKKEGRVPAVIRNWAFGIGMFILIFGGIVQDYIWVR